MDPVIQAAMDARGNAHAPYSKYRVGAAVETENGTIIEGCNVESSSFGLTICAERVALGAAITKGHQSFKSIVVASKDGASPCGACRQVIWDLCGNIPITLIDEEGNQESMLIGDLLPKPFDNRNLSKVTDLHRDPPAH